MTEVSYLWDGIITGDATEAPYDKAEFNEYINGIHSADTDDVLVIPGYLDDLEVTTSGGLSVSIKSGAALIQNYLYINTENTAVSIEYPSSNTYRYDFIVLRLNKSDQQVRVGVVKGTEVEDYTALEDPILTQTSAIWETPLAKIYLPGSSVNVQSKYIYDERIFAVTKFSQAVYSQDNIIKNSELMAIDSSDMPEGWEYYTYLGIPVGTMTTQTAATKTDIMPRGQTITLQGTKILLINNYLNIHNGDIFTLKGTFREETGNDSYIRFTINTLSSAGAILSPVFRTIEYIRLEADDEVQFTVTFKVEDADQYATGIQVQIYSPDGDTSVGQLILVRGYHPGPFRQIREYIPFATEVTDASWSDTPASTGTTGIDFTIDFNAQIMPQTRAVLLRLRGRDSGSAAGAPYMDILGYFAPFNSEYGHLDLQGVTNDVYRENTCVAPVNQALWDGQDETPQLRIDLVATGAGTFDATVEVLGIFV